MLRSFKPVSILLLAAVGMLALAACAAPAANAADGIPADTPHTISVSGSGTAYSAPDIATAQVGVQTRDTDPAAAVSANTEKMTAIIAALKAQGIDEKDIQTTNFSVSAQQEYNPQGQPTGVITFVVDNTVTITVRDISKVGAVLSAVVDAGANNIYGVSFSSADQTGLEAQARDKAMADARARADQLAKAAGVSIDTVLSINESITGGPVPYAYAARDSAASAPVPVQGGQIQVGIQVNVVYIIK
ncbi:MAG: SIMPL domain-containing protein [Anaerolineales bacterium]